MGYEQGNNQMECHRLRKVNETLWDQELRLEPIAMNKCILNEPMPMRSSYEWWRV